MPNQPQRVVTLSREAALHSKVQGQILALIELDDLQNRLEVMIGELTALASTVSDLRRRYGPRTLIDRLDDRELERVLNVLHVLADPGQTFRVE
ncbi:MAG: hypothetical protein AB1762_08940 [Gemmatimonadota bacterium]